MFRTNFRLTAFDGPASDTAQRFASALPSGDALIWVAGAAMFLLVAIVLFHGLRDAKFVKGGGRGAVSILVALLAVIGLFSGTGGRTDLSTVRDPQSDVKTTVHFILVPYAALALAIVALLSMFMLMLVVRVCRRGCVNLHTWRQRFGLIKAKRQPNIRGGGASDGGRLSHEGCSGQSTGFSDNDD